MTDFRTIRERYDWTALVKAVSDAHLNIAEQYDDWVGLAKAMACAGFDVEDFLLLSGEASTFREKENRRLFQNVANRNAWSRDVACRNFLSRCKRNGIDLRKFYIPPEKPFLPNMPTVPSAPAARVTKPQPLPAPLPERQTLGEQGLRLVQAYRQNPHNTFTDALVATGILTEAQMLHAAEVFRLGTARNGSVIFWQIDASGEVHDGKVMRYGPDAHRVRDGSQACTTVSFLLKHARSKDGTPYLPLAWERIPCLFGLHQLSERPVAIVEAEKTAVICSERMAAQGYTWMATGGCGGLSVDMLRPLEGHTVRVFPDTDLTGNTYRHWESVCRRARSELRIDLHLMDLLERHATPDQKARKIDIADFIAEDPPQPSLKGRERLHDEIMTDLRQDPHLRQLIDTFDLNICPEFIASL